MTIDLQEFERLKAKVERLQRDAAKAEGALEQLKLKLKNDYDCKSSKDAKQKAAALAEEAEQAAEAYEAAKVAFESEWAQQLENVK